MDGVILSATPFTKILFVFGHFPISLRSPKNSKGFEYEFFGIIFTCFNFIINFISIILNITNKTTWTTNSSLLSIIWNIISTIDAIAIQVVLVYQLTKLENFMKFFGLLKEFDDCVSINDFYILFE